MRKYPLLKYSCWKYSLAGMVTVWFLLSLMGCGLFKSKEAKELEKTAESLIMEGMDAYQRKKYEKAGEAFQNLKDRFPYNPYAIVAELKLADSYFLNKEYLLAATAYKEFEKLHPANEIIPYVIFQLGMCYFKLMPAIDRDQSDAFRAAQEFERLVKNYPQSEYVSQAEANLIRAKKNLAAHEFYIGEFYLTQNKYEAALSRFEGILREFPETAHPPKLENYIAICKAKLAQGRPPKLKTP
ncbi:MAG: outer membrane protein assembly factor BamD [Deltaproteobacteria bacterium]|nr:outer membrane protein assembly factor BamD [Deltaproteobacteria bacterium]